MSFKFPLLTIVSTCLTICMMRSLSYHGDIFLTWMNWMTTKQNSLHHRYVQMNLMWHIMSTTTLTHLGGLAAQLHRHLETNESDSWICYLFSTVAATLLPSEQDSLIDFATSGSFKTEFNQKPLSDFGIALAKRDVNTLMPFATTYLCDSGFSALTSMKTKYRHRLCAEINDWNSNSAKNGRECVHPLKHTLCGFYT